ncbi:hypothetical protein B0H14DRAFT_67340 [Mycena olivaceomarginata]|nr:hypothetical protein B0H14DRAFT_67340 [Mycena olivaceomarginata]
MSPPNPAIINSAIMLSTSTASAVDIGPARKLPRKNACSICRKPGHYAKTCSTKTADLDMGSTAPPTVVNSDIMISASATSAVPGESGEPPDGEQTRKRVTSCGICRKPGHYAKTCSSKTAGLDTRSTAPPTIVNSDMIISASATSAFTAAPVASENGEERQMRSCGICRKPGHYAKTCEQNRRHPDSMV